jgi:hypothetical protein
MLLRATRFCLLCCRQQLLLRRRAPAVLASPRHSYADVPGPSSSGFPSPTGLVPVTNRIVWLVQQHEPKEGSDEAQGSEGSITIHVMPGAVALPPDLQGGDEIVPLATFGAIHGQPLAELHSLAGAANVPEKLLPLSFTCDTLNPGGQQGSTTLELIGRRWSSSRPPIEHKGVRYHQSRAAVEIALTVRWDTFCATTTTLLCDPDHLVRDWLCTIVAGQSGGGVLRRRRSR